MPITHTTIPVPPAKVGETEWAEAHTLPTPGEIGALTTASADALYALIGHDHSGVYTSANHNHDGVYANIGSAVTTAQLSIYLTSGSAVSLFAPLTSAVTTAQLNTALTPYLTQSSANSQFANLTSAVTTAQLAVYLLSQDASTTYARQVSAVTTAQLGVYLLSNDASTTYARQASAVTTAQLSIYLTQSSANTQFANIASAVTTAGLNTALAPYLTSASADAKFGVMKYVTADVTNATTGVVTTINDLVFSCCGSVCYALEAHLIWRSSATTTGIGIGCSVNSPTIFSFGAMIHNAAADGTGNYEGYASANADLILGTSANAAAIDAPIIAQGSFITPSTNDSRCQLIFRSEVSNSDVKIRRGSWARLTRLGT